MPSTSASGRRLGQKTVVRALISAVTIGSLFFFWAMFVNWGHGLDQALRAGAGQGSVSFTVSMSMAFMLEFFYFLPENKSLRIPFSVVMTMSIVIAVTAVVHVLIGTPEIIRTMALPFVMGVVYTSVYGFRLSRIEVDATTGLFDDSR